MWVLLVLLLSLEVQNWGCARKLAKSPASLPPPHPTPRTFSHPQSPASGFQELHGCFGKETCRGLQEATDNGSSRSQANVKQELNNYLLSDCEMCQRPRSTYLPRPTGCFNKSWLTSCSLPPQSF